MSRLDKIRRALDWAHHAYWIGELLISLGIGKRVQALITKRFSVSPEWSLPLWLIISGLVFFVVAWAASRVVKKGTQTRDAAQTNEPPVSNVPIAVGLTFEFAEVEIRPEEGYKFKLRVYLANHSGVTDSSRSANMDGGHRASRRALNVLLSSTPTKQSAESMGRSSERVGRFSGPEMPHLARA